MMLHALLQAQQAETLERWMSSVRGKLAPELMPPIELEDHFPDYLREIISALRVEAGLPAHTELPEESDSAAEHGEQRLRLGFSLDAVVREYGALRDAIVETARLHGVTVSAVEYQVLFDTAVTGIAGAVTEYSRQRDAELHRASNEHVAFIAHELRNPLISASMAVKVLQRHGQLPTEGRAVTELVQGLHQMTVLLDHSLNLARIGGGIEAHREWVALRDLFSSTESENRSDAEDRKVTVKLDVQDVRVHVDARLLRSAVGNLVRNAVKYSREGGQVVVRGKFEQGRVTIEVEDACGGLPPGKVEEAFAPFVRLASAEEGFGLGLALAKQALDAHGGNIRVQNLPGKGCIFVLELPSKTELPDPAPSP